jgi:hypothetical protein
MAPEDERNNCLPLILNDLPWKRLSYNRRQYEYSKMIIVLGSRRSRAVWARAVELGETNKGSWMCQLDVTKRIKRRKLGFEGEIQNM